MALLNHLLPNSYDTFDQLRFNLDDMPKVSTGRIAIVGLPGSGKKTLCNSLWGWDAVQQNGETTRNFGLITLFDLSVDPYEMSGILYRLENTDLIIFVLDAERGLDPDAFNWIARLRGLNSAMLIVLNKADRIPDQKRQPVLEYLETRTARPVIPLKAIDPQDVKENLLAAILHISPDLAVPLAMEMPGLRSSVASHTVMQAVMTAMTLNLEVNTRHDSSVLVGLQLRLIRQIAAIYGYKEQNGMRQRIGLTVALRWLIHMAIKQSARLQHLDSRVGGGMVSVVSTFIVGRGAMLVYGGQLPGWLARYTPQAWRTNHVNNGKS